MTPTRIIAVDFDGCICTNAFPEIGEPIWSTIDALNSEHFTGAKIILWTCRVGEKLQAAVQACKEWGVPLDAVNANVPEALAYFGGTESRKITATEYWDDRAVVMPRE